MKSMLLVMMMAISAPAMALDCSREAKRKTPADLVECDIRNREDPATQLNSYRPYKALNQSIIESRKRLLASVRSGRISRNAALDILERDLDREDREMQRIQEMLELKAMLMEQSLSQQDVDMTCRRQPDGSSRCTSN